MNAEDYQRDALRMLKLAALAPKDEEMDRYAALAVFYMREAIKALLPERREEPTE